MHSENEPINSSNSEGPSSAFRGGLSSFLVEAVRKELSSYTKEELLIMLAAAAAIAVVVIFAFGVEILSFLLMHFRGWRL